MTEQAKDITDAQLLVAVRECRGRNGVPAWASLWDVQKHLAAYHPKVVLAKLRSAVKRGVLGGCACGCRGDFRIKGDELDRAHGAVVAK